MGTEFPAAARCWCEGWEEAACSKAPALHGDILQPSAPPAEGRPHTAMSPPQLCTEELGLPNAAVFLSFFLAFSFHLSCLVNTPALVKRSPFRSHLCYFCGLQMQGAACFSSLISVRLPGSRSRIWAWEVGNNELQSLGQHCAGAKGFRGSWEAGEKHRVVPNVLLLKYSPSSFISSPLPVATVSGRRMNF